MSARVRKVALVTHIILSVGWIGAVAAYLSLDVAAATSQDVQSLRAAYLGMDTIARSAIVPLSIVSLLTGLVMALGTKWGLFRHWWVLISFLLTVFAVAVLLVETRTIGASAAVAADPAATADDLRALGSTLLHSVGGMAVLIVIVVLNVYKPPGMTVYGWRRRQQELTALGRRR